MKNIISILFITIGVSLSAQVGIKTESPKATLDVNGDTNLRGKLAVLDVTNNTLSEGTDTQILVSQGEDYPPTWKTLRIPEYEPNKFYLIFNNSFSDNTGISFTSSEEPGITSRAATFTKNSAYSTFSKFKKIAGLSQTVNIFSTVSKAYFQFETVVHANFAPAGTTDTSIDYACGIFIDDKLINMRQGNLRASSASNTFVIHNQIGLVENLSKGAHTVSVACSRLDSYNVATGSVLGIGRAVASNIDSFIAQSSLKVDVYEVPQVFNTITN
ncbi:MULTISPECIES: hypothetical protein [Chryseobacterium]|uniref:Uncharacterized protein n=1 Tax=Chryseobacterium geocarposphaerae TaxID=1416776 RepID=A0ABU1LF80_9FLAO|nr:MULTISPECIES: hypothetical protein [Chryseobacterium]MDR6405383.1 hypothetical protein [Chryseobacterium geocarposphaerae]MDR6697542.1 hypothetical protein [Chryseobacterium ginsenosidimutans]